MKKYIKLFVITVFVLLVAVVAAKSVGNVMKEAETTTTVQTTTVQTTTVPTTVPTTAPTTMPTTALTETLIDINSITVIDLYPLSLAGGSWDVKHCQGIAVDKKKGYIYYSYTTLFVKCDFDGNLVGSVAGVAGHLGDITYNEADGKVYCGYNSAKKGGFYAAIFDVDKITKMNMKPTKDIVRTVYLKEPYEDYLAKVDIKQNGQKVTVDHKYGCSGIDGVTFGPDFSKKYKKELLTVAYGIYSDNKRTDNNYQILVQYDVTDWWDTLGKPYSSKEFHRSGPDKPIGKYFVYTGNTLYGVQTMEYFDELNLWILNCYKGSNRKFACYSLFVIDGDVAPKLKKLKGQPKEDKQLTLTLYQDGRYDKNNDIFGWNSTFGVQGIAYMSDGLFYIVRPYNSWTGTKTAICYLSVWAPEKSDPFELAAGIGNDYSISKKPRVETTAAPTTKKPTTTKAPVATQKTTAGQTSTTNPLQGLASLLGQK